MSTTVASSVFLSSEVNMIFNQSARLFSLGYFLIQNTVELLWKRSVFLFQTVRN